MASKVLVRLVSGAAGLMLAGFPFGAANVAAGPAPAPAPSLMFEDFCTASANYPSAPCGSAPAGQPNSGTADCNPAGTSTITFSSTGVASGPYPGIYQESGTFVITPTGTTFSSSFTIDPVAGSAFHVSGTKSAAGTAAQGDGGSCLALAGGGAYAVNAVAAYTAVIQVNGGSFTDSGQGVETTTDRGFIPCGLASCPLFGHFHEGPFHSSTGFFTAPVAFVIGDGSVSSPSVTFWGAQWARDNPLTGGPAPSSFKGFADHVAGWCGSTWTWSSEPGTSSAPPASVPPFMVAVVTSRVVQSGSTISGDVLHLVAVATDPGYAPDPGHPGTGHVIGMLC